MRIFDYVNKRALVTRASARRLWEPLVEVAKKAGDEFVVDFEGVEAITPSFVDELIGLISRLRSESKLAIRRVRFENVPTRLSTGFAAIGRGRGAELAEMGPNVWSTAWGPN
ncbi:MAG: STAS-like domain-containing protein [Chloroflexi bacterium]|nr:STAS-like domain-containing protein [Chloroflexota bacterium]